MAIPAKITAFGEVRKRGGSKRTTPFEFLKN
jgi:hypothetical protein